MVIITGLGRCGTSILTKYLSECGYGIGKNVNWHPNARAGFELSTFYTLTHDLYHRYCKLGKPINLEDECWGEYWKGLTYGDAIRNVDNDERQGKVDFVKDPRITWHPDLIEAIVDARWDIQLIICHREPEAVMESRESLPVQYGDPKPRKKLEDYKIDFADFYTRVLKLDIPYIALYYPDFCKNFGETYQMLKCVFYDLEEKKAKRVWDKLIDKSLLGER